MVDKVGGDISSLQASSGSVVDENGETIVSTDTVGGSSYILGPTLIRAIVGGVANGDFAKPPLDAEGAISDDNPLPYWTWVDDTSSGRITAALVANGSAASGNVLRFTAVGAQNNDKVYLERYISVLGSQARTLTYQPRTVWSAATSNANLLAFTEAVFVKNDGSTVTGGSAAGSASGSAIASSSFAREIQANPNQNGAVPIDGAFIRLRFGIRFIASVAGTATADACEVRIDSGSPQVLLTDVAAPQTYGYGTLYLSNGGMFLRANEAGTAGANPTIFLSGQSGDVAIRSYHGVGTAVPSSGHIYLQPKDTSGRIYITNGTASSQAGFYTYEANGLRMDSSDSRFIVGERTSASVNAVDDPGIIISGSSDGQGGGFVWAERDVDAATDAALFLSSNYLNASWQAIRFLRKITSGGTALSSTGHILVANNTTTAPSFAAGSDYRLKDNVRDADSEIDFLDLFRSARPVLYREKGIEEDGMIGFIAHELQELIPEAVEGEKDAIDENGEPIYQQVAPGRLIPYLVGAVRALSQKVEVLEDRIEGLEA